MIHRDWYSTILGHNTTGLWHNGTGTQNNVTGTQHNVIGTHDNGTVAQWNWDSTKLDWYNGTGALQRDLDTTQWDCGTVGLGHNTT